MRGISAWSLIAAAAAACGGDPDVEVVGTWSLPESSVCDVFCADGERFQWIGRCDEARNWTCWEYDVEGSTLYLNGVAATEIAIDDGHLVMFGARYVPVNTDPPLCSQRCVAP